MFTRTAAQKFTAVAVAALVGAFGATGVENSAPYDNATTLAATTTLVDAPATLTGQPLLLTGPVTTGYREQIRAFLNTLPGGASTKIEWGNPSGHLGGVYMPGGNTIILNAARLEGKTAKTKDVIRHEIAHIHMNRTMARTGISMATYRARMNELFGGVEKAADACAKVLGAGWVAYKSNFTAAQLQAARMILADQMP